MGGEGDDGAWGGGVYARLLCGWRGGVRCERLGVGE